MAAEKGVKSEDRLEENTIAAAVVKRNEPLSAYSHLRTRVQDQPADFALH
jgi:hypothetical protein